MILPRIKDRGADVYEFYMLGKSMFKKISTKQIFSVLGSLW